MKGKIFTLEEARRTLPLVRQIAADIVDLERERHRKATRYAALYDCADPTPEESDEMIRLEADIANLRSLVMTYEDELNAIGCFLKDSRKGLVEWYADLGASLEGRIVYLCWMHGEPDILHYHETDTGLQGRKPLPEPAAPSSAGVEQE